MGFRAWLLHLFNQLMGRPYEYAPLAHEHDAPGGIKIIRTTSRHAKAIHALEKECFSDPWSIRSLKFEITHPQSVCLSAVKEKKVLGHITMRHVLDEGHINNIAVAEHARRQGIGQRLIEALISQASALGITSLTLEVRSKNHAAISLYEKLGFVTCGHRKNYYHKPTDDALVMWKEDL